MTAPPCPQCGKNRNYKDGQRKTAEGLTLQRYLCRECGYRFSESTALNGVRDNTEGSQQNFSFGGIELLATQTETKTVCAGLKRLPLDARGLIVQYVAYLEKEGYSVETEYVVRLKTLIRQGANLLDPENVKEVIGRQKTKQGSKLNYCYAYASFAKMKKLNFEVKRL